MTACKKIRIEFTVNKSKVIGNLFIPENKKVSKYPAVFVAGPMTSVKEQVTGVYAKAISERGFVTLAIDHRYFGESGGEPRQYEKFHDKILDIKNALNFLKKRPEVDESFVSLVGVCLGAGYVLATASQTLGIYRLAAVAGYYRDINEMKKKNANDFDNKILTGINARKDYELTGKILNIPAASLDEEAAMQTRDTVDYYTKRAAVKNYVNSFAVMSREFFTKFDVQIYSDKIENPFLMIHSKNALSPHWADKFYNNVKVKKTYYSIQSSGQTDFYDDTRIIHKCTDHISKFFQQP